MDVQTPIPPEIEKAKNELKEMLKTRRQINAKIAQIKEEMNFSDLKENIRDRMDTLYDYMKKNNLEKIDSYSLNYCKPLDEKKDERREKKLSTVKETLKSVPLSPEKVEKIIEKLQL